MLKIVVAIKFYKGEIGPFDESALECALSVENAEVILLAMADRFSARGAFVTDEMVNENISGLNKLLNFYLSLGITK